MKRFGIWRYENSIGNSAEHIIGLAKYLKKHAPKDFKIFVETSFQKAFALCIPGVSQGQIEYFPTQEETGVTVQQLVKNNPDYQDIYMPGPNDEFINTYDAAWSALSAPPDITLKFNEKGYENRFNLPKNAIVVFYRQAGTWGGKRDESSTVEPERFVDPKVYFDLCFHFAKKGHKVVRIGDKNQALFPCKYSRTSYGARVEFENLIDFTKYLDDDGEPLWSFEDYLFLLQNSQLFISADAGIWPMVAAMKKDMVFSNVIYQKYTEWLPKDTTEILFKHFYSMKGTELEKKNDPPWCVNTVRDRFIVKDNTFEEILNAAARFVKCK